MMKSKLVFIRYIKRSFLRIGIHRFIPAKLLIKLGYISLLSKWIRKNRNKGYTSFPYNGFNSKLREGLYNYLIETQSLDDEIDYLEFGVAKGTSFKWWIAHIHNIKAQFNGFDTFTGLPEDWGHFKKGDMSSNNQQPKIDDNRHQFHQGLFQVTLPQFLENYTGHKRKVIHLDADLFSSTLFVLTSLSPYLKPGDILIFDEFNVPLDEFKAFKVWVDSYYINYQVLGEANNFYQTAIRIE